MLCGHHVMCQQGDPPAQFYWTRMVLEMLREQILKMKHLGHRYASGSSMVVNQETSAMDGKGGVSLVRQLPPKPKVRQITPKPVVRQLPPKPVARNVSIYDSCGPTY